MCTVQFLAIVGEGLDVRQLLAIEYVQRDSVPYRVSLRSPANLKPLRSDASGERRLVLSS